MTCGPSYRGPDSLGWMMSSNSAIDRSWFRDTSETRAARDRTLANLTAAQDARARLDKRVRRRTNTIAALTFTVAVGLFVWALYLGLNP